MITENGIVTDVNSSLAWIRTIRSGTCESCSSKDNCGTSHSGKKEMITAVKNTLNVKKGDQVVIGLETKPEVLFGVSTTVSVKERLGVALKNILVKQKSNLPTLKMSRK